LLLIPSTNFKVTTTEQKNISIERGNGKIKKQNKNKTKKQGREHRGQNEIQTLKKINVWTVKKERKRGKIKKREEIECIYNK
jgi:hypothetical protein